MELLPAVTAWLDSRTRVLKKNVADAIENPVEFVDKQVTNFNEDMRPDQVLELEQWKKALLGQGKGLLEGEAATAVLGKAFGPAGMAAAQATSVLTPMLVGAFRPVGSKLLPSQLDRIAKIITPDPFERVTIHTSSAESLAKNIQGKISNKALQKYGAPDFPLDPFLGHVRGTDFATKDDMLYAVHPVKVTLRDISEIAQDTIVGARTLKADKAFEATGKSFNGLGRSPEERLAALGERERSLKLDLDTLRDSIRYKTDVYDVSFMQASNDITEGAYNLSQVLETTKYTPDQLSKKSLEQLVSIGKKVEAAQLKEASVIKDFTISRSAQLNKEQGLPKGFVELKTQQDLGAETEFMNNCVGAGGAHPRTGKFLPKWHPITGEQITKGFAEDSGDQYWKRLQSGNERIFSYRPEGLPVATIRMDTRTGNVLEALGVENRPIPESMTKEIKLFTDQKRAELLGFPLAAKYRQIASDDPFAHNVPRAIEELIRPRGEGAVQVAAWEAEQAALRAARELNPPPAQIAFPDWD